MIVAHRIHLGRHADTQLEGRQLGRIISGVTAAVLPGLGLGNTKTNNPNQPTQPPGQPNGNNTPAAKPAATPTIANVVSAPSPTGGSGGGNSGGGSGGTNGGGGSSSNGGGGGGGTNVVVGGGSNGGGGGGSNGGGGSSSNGGGGGGSSNVVVGGGGGGGSGSGGGGGGGTATSAGPAKTPGSPASNRTGGTPSNTPSSGGTISNDGSSGTGSIPNSAGTVNVGSGGPHGSVDEGLSDSTPGTRTSVDPSGSNPSTTGNTLDGGKTGIAAGSIAAAVILSLLFVIAVVVFILRRRSSKRRDELAIRWWFTRNPTSQSYGDNEALNGTYSRRSSFATTLDHSKAFSLADTTIPLPPPMAEFGRPIGTDPALVLDIDADQNRFSIGSANSHNSQFLVVHHRESLQHETSASLMSCTESFPFPKPPPSPGADRALFCEGSRPSSISPKKREPEMQYTTSPTHSMWSTTPQIHNLSDPFSDNNPFEDSVPVSVPSGIETVRRPFIPQLHDELEVNIGDSVRVVQVFDDGWAFVEKMSPTSQVEQGLVPVNCLLDPVQNPLLGGKRMSSHSAKIT